MLLAPTYPEIDSERDVVLEEIAMYEDEPQDRVHDILADAVFGEHPLGRRVLGEAEVISSVPVPEIEAYRSARYTGANIVVGAAGNVDHARRSPTSPSAWSRRPPAPPPTARPPQADGEARLRFYEKDTEQYHICFGAPGIIRDDERRYALAVLDSIFGGSSSSRLFVEVREKRGLAYSVGSYSEQYTDSGLVATYVGTREDNVEEACSIIGAELARLRSEPVTAEELTRAKENVKGRLVLSSESTAARMTRISRATLFDLPIDSLDEMLAKVDAVTRRRPDRAGRRALRPRAPLRRLRRPRREPLPRGARPGQREPGGRVIRVAVSGAAGRMGQAVCEAVEGAEDTELGGEGRSRPSGSSWPTCSARPTSSSTSPRPTPRSPTPKACLEAGVHVVVGTTGFDLDALRPAAEASQRQLLRRPQLRDRRRAADGGRADDRAAHARVRDRRAAPRQEARRPLGHGQAHRRADRRAPAATSTSRSTRCGCPAWSPTRRSSSAARGRR